MEITYETIVAHWKQGNTTTIATLHSATKNEAIESAKFSGYIEPKWWQFWKNDEKLKMVCY